MIKRGSKIRVIKIADSGGFNGGPQGGPGPDYGGGNNQPDEQYKKGARFELLFCIFAV
jgi:hypothetical protein